MIAAWESEWVERSSKVEMNSKTVNSSLKNPHP
jgi:hypothetical protein